jgi:hypothetical protein
VEPGSVVGDVHSGVYAVAVTGEHRFLARIPEPLWEQAQNAAEATGTSVNAVVVSSLNATLANTSAASGGATYYAVSAGSAGSVTLTPTFPSADMETMAQAITELTQAGLKA